MKSTSFLVISVAKKSRGIANTRIIKRKVIIFKPRMSSGPRPK